MMDLSTRYLGLTLKNPLVASASPLTESLDNIRRMEDAGLSAIVLHSLFEEQINIESEYIDRFLSENVEQHAEALSYFPDLTGYNLGPEGYLELIHKAKQAVGIPIIASLNGVSDGGWVEYSRRMEQAGADALELNVYYIPTNAQYEANRIEQIYVDLISHIRGAVKIPLAVKLGPYFSSMANMARQLDDAGANALVLFNRFYQPDFDLESLDVQPRLSLSTSEELLLRLHWVAILYGRVRCDLAVTGGVHTAQDVLKAMMAGARVAMTTSGLLKHGIEHAAKVLADLRAWMTEREYQSIHQMQGSMSQLAVPQPAAFERANYLRVLSSYALK
jgi:dihydroorotate dehydrogenase (fumarate)